MRRVSVEVLDGNLDLPDSVFVEDTAVVLDELAVLTPMGAPSRRGESALIAAELSRHRRVERIEEVAAKLEGGDVLRVGRRLFVGLGTRTDEAGASALREIVSPHGYEVITLCVPGCLHLKTGCTALDNRTILINEAFINEARVDTAPFASFRRIPVAPDEPFAANVLRLGEAICMHAGFPATRRLIEEAGYDVKTVDIGEFLKAEAGLTCMSLVFSA